MTYARSRLWLGVFAVGTLVTLATVSLLLGIPSLAGAQAGPGGGLRLLVAGALVVGAVLFPFDVLGGYILPWEYERSRENLASFLGRWLRGATLHALALTSCLTLLYTGGRLGGWLGSVAVAWFLTQLLVLLQPLLARLVGDLEAVPGDVEKARARLARWGLRLDRPVSFLHSQDRAFVGGWTGLPGQEGLILPARWRRLEARDLAIQLARRLGVLHTGSRARGIRLAQGWVVAGWGLALWLTGADPATASGVLRAWLAFQLWSFLGLLTLPTPSRAGVHEADAYAAAQGVSPVDLLDLAERLDADQEDEPVRAPHVETIFHPIPSLATRRHHLEDHRTSARGAWQAARVALYLSWVTGGLLSRAVHCNLGRPELWVFLPGD